MRTNKKKFWADEKGQGMTEYIIIVALIAIASITLVGFFGDQVRGLFSGAGDELSGDLNDSQNQENTEENINTYGEF